VILVDTSVWLDHFRRSDPDLMEALDSALVLMHPFILGELASGDLKRRTEVLSLMSKLPQAAMATDDEALEFIDRRRLMGRGIGYIDVHLLASVVLTGTAKLWTRDKRLSVVADDLALNFERP